MAAGGVLPAVKLEFLLARLASDFLCMACFGISQGVDRPEDKSPPRRKIVAAPSAAHKRFLLFFGAPLALFRR